MKREVLVKKRVLLKLGAMIVFILCLNLICKHMPYFIEALFSSVFGILGFSSFLVVSVLFICGIIVGKISNIDRGKFCVIGVVAASLLGLFLVLCGPETIRDSYDDMLPERSRTIVFEVDLAKQLQPKKSATLISHSSEGLLRTYEGLRQWIFMEYYFDDKSVIISKECEEERETGVFQYITQVSVSPEQTEWSNKVYTTDVSLNEILKYPHYDVGETSFVLDDYWESTNYLVVLKVENKNIVCSEELINGLYNKTEDEYDTCAEEIDAYEMLANRTENQLFMFNFKQIAILLSLLLLGLVFSVTFWGDKFPILSVFMGVPIGAAEWCFFGTVLTLIGVRYSLFSMLIMVALLNGGIILLYREKYKSINWNLIINWTIMLTCIISIFVYLQSSYTTYDSIVKCAMGYRLAKYGTLQDILAYAAPYGMLEPMIMSIGYLIGCDYVYAFYPVMVVSGIGIMFASNYYLYKKSNVIVPTIILVIGSLLLITNEDFILSAFYVMAHGPIAVYALLLVVFIVMRKQIEIDSYNIILFLASSMIVLSRIEGAIYVLFILISSMAIESKSLDMRRAVASVSLLIIIWNLGQLLYVGEEGDPVFWTPQRGILLILASVISLLFVVIMKRNNIVLKYIKEHLNYFILFGIIALTVLVSVLFCRSMALVNLPIFLGHFSNNIAADTNAAAFWSFMLLLTPYLITKKEKMAVYSLSLILGNVLLIYFICLLREGAPIRFGFYDSARRTIVQFMPMSLWVIANCYYNCKTEFLKDNK